MQLRWIKLLYFINLSLLYFIIFTTKLLMLLWILSKFSSSQFIEILVIAINEKSPYYKRFCDTTSLHLSSIIYFYHFPCMKWLYLIWMIWWIFQSKFFFFTFIFIVDFYTSLILNMVCITSSVTEMSKF